MRRKVLFLPKWYPNDIVPLSGNFIANHARAVQLFADVSVLFVRSADTGKGMEVRTDQTFTEVHVFFQRQKGWKAPLNGLLYFRAQLQGYKKVREIWTRPDCCHVHVLGRNALLAIYLRWSQEIPFFVSEHWSGFVHGRISFYKSLFYRRVAKMASGVSAVSEYLAQGMKSYGISVRVRIIPNVVDTELFSVGDDSHPKRDMILVCDLRDDVKNISGTLRAFRQLLKRRSEITLKILGDGPDRSLLKDLTEQLGMKKNVAFLGETRDRGEVAALIRNSAFLTLFSHYETFGIVLAEALSCGTPVVASRLPSIQEFITDECGILVTPGDEEELEEAWDRMLNEWQNYDANGLHVYAASRFSQAVVGKIFADWYAELS